MPIETMVIIPCFNEEKRLNVDAFISFSEAAFTDGIHFFFVNDGSTDQTRDLLKKLCTQNPEKLSCLDLAANQGKGNAIRLGMLEALKRSPKIIGYLDADLSTSLQEMARMNRVFQEIQPKVLMGSRVALLGHDIQRKPYRHYLGRIFATIASIALDLPVYDTQCGAKLFLSTPHLRAALSKPFRSSWVFDVELLQRLLTPSSTPSYRAQDFLEVPLKAWRDVEGSKLKFRHMILALLDLMVLACKRSKSVAVP